MIRRLLSYVPLAAVATIGALSGSLESSAQDPTILAEVYGRGVHAYYSGQYSEAYSQLSSAISGGSQDPRAYYFRGIVSYRQGRTYEAEGDWMQGAQLEATGRGGSGIGRSLSRFQGSGRLKLEEFRQKARLEALANAASRSNTRLKQLGVQPGAAAPPVAMPMTPAPANPAAPAPVGSDPFAGDDAAMAGGQPKVESSNALEGLDDNPFADDPPAGGADAAPPAEMGGGDAGNPFGDAGGAGTAEPGDPFGTTPDAGDPFGGSADETDPFGDF